MADISYSGRDFTAEVERLKTLMRQRLPEWTDLNYSDPGAVFQELMASTTDLLNGYMDKLFFELFIEKTRFRQNMIANGRTSGYLPNLASAASTRLQFTRATGVRGAIPVPAYSAFGRADGLEYCTITDVTIPDGVDTIEADALQGTFVQMTLSASDFAVTDRTKFPRKSLGTGVAAGSVVVTHGTPAMVWTEVESFWQSRSDDYHFYCQLDGGTDEALLTVGDGTQGAGPASSPMTVSFLRTAGAAGNCGSGVITTVSDSLVGLITCTNTEIATGGAPSATLSELRSQIPACAEAQRRMDTEGDYEALIGDMPWVLRVAAYDRGDSTAWPHAHVILYVVPEGGGPMTTLQRDEILDYCCKRGGHGNWRGRYVLYDAVPVPVNISARIAAADGYVPSSVAAAAQLALAGVLAPGNQEIGGTLEFNTLQAVGNAVAGLRWIEFDSPTGDITAGMGQILTAGTVSVTVSS